MSKLSVVPSSRPSPLVRLVDDYLADVKARGLSPKTIKYSIGWPLREIFLPWAADNDISSVDELDNRTLNRFSAHLQEHGGKKGALKPASIWTYSKSVRRFLAWAKAEGEKVTGEVKLPKLPQVIVETLSRKEIAQLEEGASSIRDALIVRLLADTGMRREELTSITTKDLFEEGGKGRLLIHGKGRRDRHVPITPSLTRRLRKYIAGRPDNTQGARVFVGLKNRPDGSRQPLTPSGVTQMVSALGERVLGKPTHPHQMRHSFIAEMRRRRVDIVLVAQLVGHTSLAMIQNVYNGQAPDDAHDELMRALRAED